MRLGFVYVPVTDFPSALAFYRDTLGLDEKWREGETTAGFTIPGTDVGLMIDQDTEETQAGPFFVVPDVRAFYAERSADLKFVSEPREIPPGMYATFLDPAGNLIRIMDTSKDRA